MTYRKTMIALAAGFTMAAAPAVFAQSATTLGGGGASRANGGAAGSMGAGSETTGRSGSAGATSNEVGSRASSAAKGNDPSGTNGATNNRY